ncbi:MAG: diguanylate cyclase [Chloroflexi bacterium]|nr:diguanylate cyclase [Chloroflexota bacterium]
MASALGATVVEGVREVIFRVDAEGRLALLNHAWEELTDHPVIDSIGRSVMGFIHPDDRELSGDLAQPVAQGQVEEYRHEFRLVGRDGSDIWVEAHARPVHDDAGLFSGMSGTLTDVTARRKLEERLVMQAFHDDLTGLANRALFKDRVEHALTLRSQASRLVGLLFLDLNRFKTVNDSLGHTAGDGLLIAIGERLKAAMRPEDTIARLGGDELPSWSRTSPGRSRCSSWQSASRPHSTRRSDRVSARSPSVAASAWWSRRVGIARPTTSCATPTWRCTGQRSAAAGRTHCSSHRCRRKSQPVSSSRPTCARRSSTRA